LFNGSGIGDYWIHVGALDNGKRFGRSLSGIGGLASDYPKNASEGRNDDAGKRRNNAVVLVKKEKLPQDEGRDSVPVDTLIWGAILALSAYLGKVWAEHRYEGVVDHKRRRQRGKGA
jgi:hypothetical protein